MKKKIAYILTNYTTKPDGIAIYSENILFELYKYECSIDIYILKKNAYFFLERLKKNNKLILKNIIIKEVNFKSRFVVNLYLNIILNIKKYNLVVHPSLVPVLNIKNKSIKVIHDYTFKKFNKSLSFFQNIYKHILHYFIIFDNYVGYISKTTLKDINYLGHNFIKKKNKIYLPNGLPYSFQQKNVSKETFKNKIIFLFVGSKNLHKGFDKAIKLVNCFSKIYPNYEIDALFAGKKKYQTNLILNENKLSDKVNYKFYDYVDDKLLSDLYEKSHFLIFLSKSEGFGLPILEAIKFKCFPILSNLNIFREIINIKDYPLFLVQDNLTELSKNIDNLITDVNYRNSMYKLLDKILYLNKDNFKSCSKKIIKLL